MLGAKIEVQVNSIVIDNGGKLTSGIGNLRKLIGSILIDNRRESLAENTEIAPKSPVARVIPV